MAKIAITGHTKGIGKSCKDLLEKDNEILGFSRSNGYDISDNNTIQEILNKTYECKIFINNAYHDYQQCNLAEAWHRQHFDDEFLIINIGSIAVEIERFLPEQYKGKLPYVDHKRKLNTISENINYSGSKSKSVVVSFGVVDTTFPLIPKIFYDKTKHNGTIITPDEAAKVVVDVINKFNNKYFCSTIVVLNNDKYF